VLLVFVGLIGIHTVADAKRLAYAFLKVEVDHVVEVEAPVVQLTFGAMDGPVVRQR